MKTQIELLKEAVKIAEENPTLEIIIAANSDELLQEYGWTKHQITSVEISQYCEHDDKIITDIDELIENMEYDLDRDVTEEEAEKEMKNVILIKTGAN